MTASTCTASPHFASRRHDDARRSRFTRARHAQRHLPTDFVGKLVDILRKPALTR
ncbi:hypothetical protein G3O00_24455 [Burkholderia sp. Ac-20384]|uniref:hypothetical protein n=1 Tax=Burkholderia sp. Ac-20384 TaxID=2703902 RepID=UPI00198120C0|nr:hypothetical protein [Burkholderia sp. Ac-20384]MBN3826755.1 hypothetical protein [Burkholderia sp. Ac-20384]